MKGSVTASIPTVRKMKKMRMEGITVEKKKGKCKEESKKEVRREKGSISLSHPVVCVAGRLSDCLQAVRDRLIGRQRHSAGVH